MIYTCSNIEKNFLQAHNLTTQSKTKLMEENEMIKDATDKMQKILSRENEAMEALLSKRSKLENAILKRHATITKLADKAKDELMSSLDSKCKSLQEELSGGLQERENNVKRLNHLQNRIQEAMGHENAPEVMTVVDEVYKIKPFVLMYFNCL